MFLFTVIIVQLLLSINCNGAIISTERVGHSARCKHPQLKHSVESVLIIGSAGLLGATLAQYLSACGVQHLDGIDNFNADESIIMKRERVRKLLNGTVSIMASDVCDHNTFNYQYVLLVTSKLSPRNCLEELIRRIARQEPVPQLLYLTVGMDKGEPSYVQAIRKVRPAFHPVRLHLQDALYGPYADPGNELHMFMDRIMSFEEITLRDGGRIGRRYTYVTDAVQRIASAVSRNMSDTMIELCSTTAVQQKDAVKMLESLLRKEAKLRVLEGRKADTSAATDVQTSSISATTMKGASPSIIDSQHEGIDSWRFIDLSVGLSTFVKWYESHRSMLLPCASECHFGHLCFASAWDAAAAESRKLSKGCRTVIYTVATGADVDQMHDIDNYTHQLSGWNPTAEWRNTAAKHCNIAFVSKGSLISSSSSYGNWTLIAVEDFKAFEEARKPTRVPKIVPGHFFAHDVEYAVYVDSKLHLLSDPMYFVATMSGEYTLPGAAQAHDKMKLLPLVKVSDPQKRRKLGFLAVRYAEHDSALSEMEYILKRGINNRPDLTHYPEILNEQYLAYKAYAAAYHIGLNDVPEGAFLIHDLKSKAARKFRCSWYEEYQSWADRDQPVAAFIFSQYEQMAEIDNNVRHEFILLGKDSLRGTDIPAELTHENRSGVLSKKSDVMKVNDGYKQYIDIYAHLLDKFYHWKQTPLIAELVHFTYDRHTELGEGN